MFYGSTKFTALDDTSTRALEDEALWARLERVEAFALPEAGEPALHPTTESGMGREVENAPEGLLGRVQSLFCRAA